MRIGKPTKRLRSSSSKAGNVIVRGIKSRPKHISVETVIGQVSLDVIETIYAPKMMQLASESLERFAKEALLYDEAMKEKQMSANNSFVEEAEIGMDGLITTLDDLPIPPPNNPLYDHQFRIDELKTMLVEASDHFIQNGGYKVHMKAAKFERLLDEKYGVLRPFIKDHPEVEQFIRSIQRKYASGYFHPIRQGAPPIPRSTSIILLFMLYRGKVPFTIVFLAAMFLVVGLQPWTLVAIIAMARYILNRRKHRVVGNTIQQRPIPAIPPYYHQSKNDDRAKNDLLLKPVGSPLKDENETIDCTFYDVIIIGHGPGTLYTASLLSRIGRKVLVLSSERDASGCLQFQTVPSTIDGSSDSCDLLIQQQLSDLPFDVDNNNIPKISRQQEILVPALSTTNDCQGGIRFAKIGTSMDDYAFEILSVPGMGCHDVAGSETFDGVGGGNGAADVPFILKGSGGISSLINDAADYLGDQYPELDNNESSTFRYVTSCEAINAKAGHFYLSKILPETSFTKFRGSTPYGDSTLHNTTEYLNQNFALNPHLRSLMAAIGMRVENLPPSGTCLAAHVTNVCNAIHAEGMHYPIGGPRAMCHAFANIIEHHGGRIVTNAPLAELVFDKSIPVKKKSKRNIEPSAPYCVGVKLRTGQEIRFSVDRYKEQPPNCPAIISMEGFIQTFIRHLSDDIRSEFKVPRGVPALSERRPVVHLLFALKGNAAELNVTGADFYRLPSAALPHDSVDPATGAIQYGDIGWVDEERITTSTPDDRTETTDKTTATSESEKAEPPVTSGRRKKKKQVKFEAGQSYIRISFPSAKDPSFESRHGNITTCVVTIEADDEFVQLYETKPKIFMRKKPTASTPGEIVRLCERVKRDLFDLYPQLSDKILHSEISGPFQKGLSHNQERYIAKGIRADTPYPGLYVGGSDLTVGDSFSGSILGGWLVANALCGYNTIDYLFLQKNITSDLQQLLEPPMLRDDDSDVVAVPYHETSDGNTDGLDVDDDDDGQ